MEAVILAAGLGKRLRPVVMDRPKCLLEINGKTLLERQIDQLRRNNVSHIWIVVGYMADMISGKIRPGEGITYVYNPQYATSNNAVSLHRALDHVRDEFVYLMGDCIYEDNLLSRLIAQDKDNSVTVDFDDLDIKYEVMISISGDRVVRIGKCIDGYPAHGRFAGAVKIGRNAAGIMHDEIDRLVFGGNSDFYTCDVLDTMIRRRGLEVSFLDVTGLYWDEIDKPEDWERVKGKPAASGSVSSSFARG
jgi:L-glutamine-phosphate cytidylyltransferase